MKLEDKVALVTGSSQGIGQEIAVRLATEGAKIVIDYRHPEGAEETLAKVQAGGSKCHLAQGVERLSKVGSVTEEHSPRPARAATGCCLCSGVSGFLCCRLRDRDYLLRGWWAALELSGAVGTHSSFYLTFQGV